MREEIEKNEKEAILKSKFEIIERVYLFIFDAWWTVMISCKIWGLLYQISTQYVREASSSLTLTIPLFGSYYLMLSLLMYIMMSCCWGIPTELFLAFEGLIVITHVHVMNQGKRVDVTVFAISVFNDAF